MQLDESVQSVAPSSLLLTELPVQAPSLLEALEQAKPNESFVFTGRIGGRSEPLSDDFAVFVVADESLEFCDEMAGDDHCETPWDACCESQEKVKAALAVVQFENAEGAPLELNLTEFLGLAANDKLVVKGHLAPNFEPENPVIVAEGIAIVN
jgi:hypothetical protein